MMDEEPLPGRVWDFLRGDHSERKLRLYATACCRLSNSRIAWRGIYREGLDLSERLADGVGTAECLADARMTVENEMASDGFASYPENDYTTVLGVFVVLSEADRPAAERCFCLAIDKDRNALHEVFGDPFRPVTFDPRWRTSDVVGLATAIYEDKAFERMPVLADALMDAGCEDEQVLGHCRGEGPHVRGCWVVDMVLGKV